MVERSPVADGNRRPRRRLPLRFALTIPFVVLILSTSGLITLLSLHTGRSSVQFLAGSLQENILTGVFKDLRHYLEMPHKLNAFNARAIRMNPGLLTDFDALREEFLAGLRVFDSVMACGIGTEPDGEFLGVGHRENGGFDIAYMRVSPARDYHHQELDPEGKPGKLLKVSPDYDARDRVWYRTAIQAGKPAWSPVYVWAAGTNIGITAVLPLYGKDGAFLGVQQSALSLQYMSRFTKSLTAGHAGQAFIMERSGLLVASSADERVVRKTASGELERMSAVESHDPLIRGSALNLKEHFGDFSKVAGAYRTNLEIDGEPHLVDAQVLSDDHGLEWIVVGVVPESQFIGRVESNFHVTALLCLVALILAGAIGVVISHRITRPILRLTDAAKGLSSGKWDPESLPTDRGDELGELASSFEQMADRTKDLVSTLESRVAERTETLAVANARLEREINERKRVEASLRSSEERLRLAFNAVNDALWDWDLEADQLYFSPRWWEMIGREPADLKTDPSIRLGMVHPDDLAKATVEIDEAIRAMANSFEVEVRLIHRDGHPIPVRSRGFVLRNEAGRAVRIVGTATDLTEQKRVEADRIDWERRFHEARKFEGFGRMAGAIAHHLNNMLGAVMGNLELVLLEIPKEAGAAGKISDAMKASRRAAEMGRLMLTYLGKVEAKKEPLDLSEAVRDGLLLLRSSLSSKIDLDAGLPPDGPVLLLDGTQINQVLTNLVLNASEAIGDTEGRIRVSVAVVKSTDIPVSRFFPADWVPGPEDHAVLAVEDTGCGMDSATRERIFDPFFSTRFMGRGMGLPVVLGLIRAYGGAVAVESTPGIGSFFRVYLPMPAGEAPAIRREEKGDARDRGAEELVLLVDDEPMMLGMAGAMLERLGYRVVTAVDGVEALEIFRLHRDEIRCVVLDLTLPRMNGWEVLREIGKIRPGFPVILASGYEEAQVMQGRTTEEAPRFFLHKPYDMKALKAAVTACVEVIVG